MSARRLILATDDMPTLIQYYNDFPEFQVELDQPEIVAELSRRFGLYTSAQRFSDLVTEYNNQRFTQPPQRTYKTLTAAEQAAAYGNLESLMCYINRSPPEANWYDQLLLIGLENQHWLTVEYMINVGANIVYHEDISPRVEKLRLKHLQDNLVESIHNPTKVNSSKTWDCRLPGAFLGILY